MLSDSEKRQRYDQFGADGVKGHPGGSPNQGGGGFDPFADMFSNMFGGGGGGFGGQQRQRRGNDAVTNLEITLEQFYNGYEVDFNVDMQNVCSHCKGTGSEDGQRHTCPSCQGQGMKIMRMQLSPGMFQQFQTTCQECGGTGKFITHKCKKCNGQQIYRGNRHHSFHVAAGTPRNHVFVLKGESDHHPDMAAGDLRVTVQESTTKNMGYRRIANNLYRTEVLSLKEALHGGWKRSIPHLDRYDPRVTLQRSKGQVILNGQVEVIKGKGMPVFDSVDDKHGDLYIEYIVVGLDPSVASKLKDEL